MEAEHEDGDEAGGTMTRTIKVPLREDSSPLDTKQTMSRGRPSGLSSARMQRSGTPTRQRNMSDSRSQRQSVTDLSVAPLGDDGDSDEWTTKKRSPRKKRQSRSRRVQTERSDGIGSGDSKESGRLLVATMRHPVSQSPPFAIHEDALAVPAVDCDRRTDQLAPHISLSPELRRIDLNRVSVRQRSQSTKRKEGRSEWSDKIQRSEIGLEFPMQSSRQVSANSATSYPTPSPTSSYHSSDEVEKNAEPTQEHENFDTVLESEGFTMIDLDTIPSARHFRPSPEGQKSAAEQTSKDVTNRPRNNSTTPQTKMIAPLSSQKKPTPIPSYLTMANDESELSSNVPSSPPPADTSLLAVPARPLKSSDRKVTPQTYSSPSLPPPPRMPEIRSSNSRPASPPREVLEAGDALQDAVISSDHNSSTSTQGQSSPLPVPRRGDFFNGFSSGTKRELRAGLRFGEELAKRQKPSALSPEAANCEAASDRRASHNNVNLRRITPQVFTQVWRGETFVQHSPFATDSAPQIKKNDHARSSDGRMDSSSLLSSEPTEARAPSRLASSNARTPKTSFTETDTPPLKTASRREHEWQLEREAVSLEIENANPSKLVVIDREDDENISEPKKGNANDGVVEKHKDPEGRSRAHTEELSGRSSKAQTGRKHDERSGARGDYEEVRHLSGAKPAAGHSAVQVGLEDQKVPSSSVASNVSNASDNEDDADENEDDVDVWLQEAKDNSSSPQDRDTAGTFSHIEQQRQRERAAEVLNKPRRSLIPSPWKRGEDVAEASTFMSDGAMSGFFWQQQTPVREAIKFGAGEIARRKRQSRGSFDLETMLSSPAKLAAVGQRNLTLRKGEAHERRKQDIGDEAEDDEVEDGSQADDMSDAAQDESAVAESQSSASSPIQPQTVPVNFNDTTVSIVATPPRKIRSTSAEAGEWARLTPPRSAMKGARLSFSPPKQDPQSDARRVVFNERSLYLNSDGEESTMSAHLDSPLPTPKANQQFHDLDVDEHVEVAEEKGDEKSQKQRDKKSSWLGWMLRGEPDESTATPEESRPSIPKLDGAYEAPAEDDNVVGVEDEADELEDGAARQTEHSQSTKTSLPTANGTNGDYPPSYSPLTDAEAGLRFQAHLRGPGHPPRQRPQAHINSTSDPSRRTNLSTESSSHPKPASSSSKLPSYLLPPSYPSLPTRDPSIPLSTSGDFTNAHFRTLHIIHAKSQRPRFHAPKRIRPAMRKLLGWKMEVDESSSLGLNSREGGRGDDKNVAEGEEGEGGVFEWTLGNREAEVLERFMQEVEFGHVLAGPEGGGVRIGEKVRWVWSIEELAKHLGMIVIGQAVRAEEGER